MRPPMPVRTAYSKPIALRLDDQGREVDDFGNLVERKADVVTTFKVGASVCERIGCSADWVPQLQRKQLGSQCDHSAFCSRVLRIVESVQR